MKNFKKISLTLGTMATFVAPVATMVSCGSTAKKTTEDTQKTGDSIRKASNYDKLSDVEKKTFDEELLKAEQTIKDDHGYDKMSQSDQAKFDDKLAQSTFEELKDKAKSILDAKIVAENHEKAVVIEDAPKKDSAFFTEEALTKIIDEGNTGQILKDLKELNFATLKNFMDKTDLEGTKILLKTIVKKASMVTENLFPLVDKILAGLKNAKVNLDQRYINLYHTIAQSDGASPLLDLLGSQVADLLDGEIDKYVTQDIITKMKSSFNQYITKNTFNIGKQFLDKIDFSTLNTFGKSIFGLLQDNKEFVLSGLEKLTKTIPQLQFLVNIVDPASNALSDTKKADEVEEKSVKEYKLEFSESGKMTLFQKPEEVNTESSDEFKDVDFASTSDLTKSATIGGTGDEELTVEKNPTQTSPKTETVQGTSFVTTVLSDFFNESDPQNLIGGKSAKFNRIIMTVLSIIGKQKQETIAEIKTILLSKMGLSYKLKEDWVYDGVVLKVGTLLNIEQYETFFMDPLHNSDKELSPFVHSIMSNMNVLNPKYDKAYVPQVGTIDPADTGFFATKVQLKEDADGNPMLDTNGMHIEETEDYSDPIILKGHFDKVLDSTQKANKLYQSPDKKIFAKEKILGTNKKLCGVLLSDYGFKDVDDFAKVLASKDDSATSFDLPNELLMIRRGMGQIKILDIEIGIPSSKAFGTGIFKDILSPEEYDLKYSRSVAEILGLDAEKFQSELTEYLRLSKPKEINKFEAGAFKGVQEPSKEIFEELGSDNYNEALKLMFKAAYSYVETHTGPAFTGSKYNWDATGFAVNKVIMGATDLYGMFSKTVEDSKSNPLLTKHEEGKTAPTTISVAQAFGTSIHDLLVYLQMARDWLKDSSHGGFEEFYKTKVLTQKMTVSIHSHSESELQDEQNTEFAAIRKVIQSFQAGLEDVFGKASNSERDGKSILE